MTFYRKNDYDVLVAENGWVQLLEANLGETFKSLPSGVKQQIAVAFGDAIGDKNKRFVDGTLELSKAKDQSDLVKILAKAFGPEIGQFEGKLGLGNQLSEALKDGKLTSIEVGGLATVLAVSRLDDGNAKQMVEWLFKQDWHTQNVENMILAWVKEQFGAVLEKHLKQAIDDEPLPHLKDFLNILVALTSQSISLRGAPPQSSAYIEAFIDALNSWEPLLDGRVAPLLQAIIKNDSKEAIIQIVRLLGLESLVWSRIATVGLKKAMRDEISNLLSKSGVQQGADELAMLIIDLIDGTKNLDFSTEEEVISEKFLLNYKIWLRTRKVAFLAKRSVVQGVLVSTVPNAKPILFEMAAIQPDTKVFTFAGGENSSWNLFAVYFNMIAEREFKMPKGAFVGTPGKPSLITGLPDKAMTFESIAATITATAT